MATGRIGYYNTGSTPDSGVLAADTQRAYIPDALTQSLIFYEMGGRFGRNGSNTGTSRMGLGTVNSSGNPSTLLGYTGSVSPSTQMTSGGTGTSYTKDLLTPVYREAGDEVSLVLTSANYSLIHGMIQAASYPNKDHYGFWVKTNASSIPTDPIGGTESYEGHMALWATGEVQVAPNVPTAVSPSGNLASTDLTPQIQASFSDDNETLPNGASYDKLDKVCIRVRRKSDSVTFWDYTYDANSTEQTNRRSDKQYAGTTLVAGTTYQVSVAHADLAGAWSTFSTYQDFTINAGGTVITTASTPTGKQNSITPGPFVAQWNHPNPLNAKAATVRLLSSSGSVIATGVDFTLGAQVASGNNISMTWANTGLSTVLSRGGSYKWQMRGQDTGNSWSAYSAAVPFTINATPSTPSQLSPSASQAWTSPPKLAAKIADADDTLASLTNTIQILRADGTFVTRTAVYNAVTQKAEYQTVVGVNEVQRVTRGGTATAGTFTITVPANVRGAQSTTAPIAAAATAAQIQAALELLPNVGAGRVLVTGGPFTTATTIDITFLMELSATNVSQVTVTSSLTGTSPTLTPSTVTSGVAGDWAGFQTLQWRMQSGDGTSTSAFSAYATFLYGAGPQVTITAPADEAVLTTSNYTATWTVPSGGPQVRYRAVLTEVDTNDDPVVNGVVFDSGDVVSTNAFHTFTNLFNGKRFTLSVTVTNSAPLSGSSYVQLYTSFTPPESVTGFIASATRLVSATGSDAVLLAWNPSLRPPDQMPMYDIYRTPLGAADGDGPGVEELDLDSNGSGPRVHIRRITNPVQAAFVDGNVPSGIAFLYEFYQTVRLSTGDELVSAAASATVSVDIDHITLTSALEPETYGVELRHKAGKGAFLNSKLNQDKQKVVPVGGQKARSIVAPFFSWEDSGTFEIISDRFVTADERMRKFNALIERGGTMCLRDFTGLRRFVSLDEVSVLRFSVSHYQISLRFNEEAFIEGEVS